MKQQRRPYGLLFSSLLIIVACTHAQMHPDKAPQEFWVEQMFQSLTEAQPIAQLFFVPAYANKDETH